MEGGPMCTREAIQRELEKEMIRGMIIAEEVERLHVLEAEVRKELMIGREIMAMKNGKGFSSSFMPTTSGAGHNPPPSLHSTELNSYSQKKNIEWKCPVCKVSAPCENGFLQHLAGKKHMAKVATINYSSKWTCPICEVSTTCESGLLDHLRGKKHKANMESLRGYNNGKSNKSVETHEPFVIKNFLEYVSNDSKEDTKKEMEWRFRICEVIATSEIDLQKHIAGRKHKAKVVTLGKGKNI
ncbi:unnamed protein product [Lactuca virosa]|uniref:C2H2-type domain-containing protein n=1 Tax=Lactuca virosa TaxID=75947 RepID=A0AAU9N183_9ASTR|nr:unnamed protein product [Lactuca virosa]